MLHRISLLEELRKGGYEASLITTFNAYLPFYEEVVLRRLVNAGVRHNVLLMDAQQYAASLDSYPPRLAGRRYTLLPVRVAGAFHPKIIFLAGKHKGLIAVGSHNMTLAGFGFNRELTNVVRIQGAGDPEGIAAARDVWNEVEHWLESFTGGIPEQVADMVRRVRDFAPWIKGEAAGDAEIKVLAGRPGTASLWDQFAALVSDEITEISVGGAFFDQELRFLNHIKENMRPNRLIVGIDPATVQISAKARSMSGVSLVRAERLGLDKEAEGNGRGYLHAKGILVRQKNGGAVFASGSANPSSPAWLATATSGNVEIMLARRGGSAIAAAEDIGFADFADLPPLEASDWETIERNQEPQAESEPARHRSGLAVVEEDRVLIALSLLQGLKKPEFALITVDGAEIARSHKLLSEGALGTVVFSIADLSGAFSIYCYEGHTLALRLLLHHARTVEEQARTGIQRRFKEALLSLETDTPNIALLIDCIDKIVFSEDPAAVSAALKEIRPRDKAEASEAKELGSLAIDVADIKKRKSKQRLNHTGDFAYLLDALIYHLRIHEDKAIEEVDRFGRSEEEQVGADDEEDAEAEKFAAAHQEELLELCHSKVRTVIGRITAQMKAFSGGKKSLDHVLVCLLGVLAVLRELRRCDGRVAWVDKGKTTVPPEQRLRLLEEVMFNLFEGQSSLLRLDVLGDGFQQSDDVARLKGLLLWLAWDCGLTLDLKKPFNESRHELDERLRRNAMVLALAQMIRADEVVIDEARQSIGGLTSSEMDWLKEVERVAGQCDSVRQGDTSFRPVDTAEPGDIAVHRSIKDWDLRVVVSCDRGSVDLVRLCREKARISYAPEHLAVARLQ